MAKETKNKNSVPQGKKKMTKTNNKKKETSKKLEIFYFGSDCSYFILCLVGSGG